VNAFPTTPPWGPGARIALHDAMRILITGATGNVGREVVTALSSRGIPLRAAVQSLGESGRDDEVVLDFRNPSTFGPALEGVTGLFLLRPPPIADVRPTLNALVDAAATRGVAHVVFLSVVGAGTNPVVPHHAVEKHLRAGKTPWTFLRPWFFAQNLGDAYRKDIRDDHRLFVPAGAGRAAFVDVRDVAEVVALAFSDVAHRGKAYDLTGPEALTFDEVAALLSEVLGRPIRYDRPGVLAYARHLHNRGLPLAQVAVQTILHLGLRLGQGERIDTTLGHLLGHAPRTMRTYIEDHRALWLPPTASVQ